MSSPEHTDNVTLTSENDRLIANLKSCFADLIKFQAEQTEKIQKSVETLKPQHTVTDTNSTFWNSYMKLVDEHDKDFQQKYSTDLDTALIFAGLFSAVSSAFIIQVQPGITPPNRPNTILLVVQSMLYVSLFATLLVTLLAVLGKQWIMHYQTAGSKGTIEERGLERQRKLDGLRRWKFDLVLQIFPILLQLALLLFSTALTVYLWTIDRCIAILILIISSFGVASYTFLLGTAMVSPDSPFQTPLAPFLLQIIPNTLCFLKWISKKAWKLTTLVWSSWIQFLKEGTQDLPCFDSESRPTTKSRTSPWRVSDIYLSQRFSSPSAEVSAVLWVLETSTDPAIIDLASEMATNLQWPLDLDLAPAMNRLADTFLSCFDRPSYHSEDLSTQVRASAIRRAINCGKMYCSLRHIARISGQPRESEPAWLRNTSWSVPAKVAKENPSHSAQLVKILRNLDEWPELLSDSEAFLVTKSALHIIPSLDRSIHFPSQLNAVEHFIDQFQTKELPSWDASSFSNYLCCLNSFLGPMNPRVLAEVNKEYLQDILVTQLFKALQTTPMSSSLVARILHTTVQLGNRLVGQKATPITATNSLYLLKETSQFCSTFPLGDGWLEVLISAAMLARPAMLAGLVNINLEYVQRQRSYAEARSYHVERIYDALERVQELWAHHKRDDGCHDEWDTDTTLAMESLLQLLAFHGPGAPVLYCPTPESFRVVLHALSRLDSHASDYAHLILHASQAWFESSLQPVMQPNIVWPQLGCIALKNPALLAHRYMEIGNSVADVPEWQVALHSDLSTWIAVFSGQQWGHLNARDYFISVLRRVWISDFNEKPDLADTTEECWALALVALSNLWDIFDFSSGSASLHQYFPLFRCTVSTSLRVDYIHLGLAGSWGGEKQFSRSIRTEFSGRLGKSLENAAENARNAIPYKYRKPPSEVVSRELKHPLERVAELLEGLGQKIGDEFIPGSGQLQLGNLTMKYANWEDLQMHFATEIDLVESAPSCSH